MSSIGVFWSWQFWAGMAVFGAVLVPLRFVLRRHQ